jgi:hypothetical protein
MLVNRCSPCAQHIYVPLWHAWLHSRALR